MNFAPVTTPAAQINQEMNWFADMAATGMYYRAVAEKFSPRDATPYTLEQAQGKACNAIDSLTGNLSEAEWQNITDDVYRALSFVFAKFGRF